MSEPTDDIVTVLFDATLRHLQLRPEVALSLDELGEIVGAHAITSAQIELLIIRLEERGVQVGGDSGVDLQGLLRAVLTSARSLRSQGLVATPQAICEESGLSAAAVQVALLYSEVIRKP